ncbi:tRNA (adenosine(37)-N6)-threonylcarbamoyltransferase complex dimerization subunit type 1 TsaB [Atopobacter sp. AH10]|uniref:tRNA (adenosine(37)-N6)-threonylcarbamoyltransferase complex dimerization subunit type 1 TsaB n=1 Tax=Atopobacter sp. AH10 TaxID=2315861 RepID=UPI000EF2108A|nr:tRNA (adenosine(37)-N6)-threonylcarbamoyltransferase complex dimerization subunit type 1 TsaB [Atopobacter sp. AH10]RLK63119.1 tRNA (adenosine(37)-N6)-threonylcarbamoyltransferase complex dimerization subunit type 1 TsaB [Atopobacter sp. AH10]
MDLAIESSNKTMSVALVDEGCVLSELTTTGQMQHAVSLMPAIEQVMTFAKLSPKDLTAIVIAKGPGSYTGIRIGGTTAKVLAKSLSVPLYPVSSLAALAKNAPSDWTGLLVPYMDARRQAVFTGAYRYCNGRLVEVIGDHYTPVDKWVEQLSSLEEEVYLIGEGAKQVEWPSEWRQHPVNDAYPKAHYLVELKEASVEADLFEPSYLKRVEAEENWQAAHPEQEDKDPLEYVRYV